MSAGNPSFGALGDCCEHECNLTDPDRCRGNVVEECRNCDTDKYNDWCKATDCASTGKTCKKGSCTVGSACIDVDGDGYGNPASGLCAKSTLDCDDSKAFINPGATEDCDKKDNNCNSSTDEGCDSDSDGYCASAKKIYTDTSMCSNTIFISDGMSGNDCNDADKNISPGASEICGNGKDDDCSGGDVACACTENWTCGAWSACAGGVITRTCTDSNSCGTFANKPSDVKPCIKVWISSPSVNSYNYAKGALMSTSFGVSATGGVAPYSYRWSSDKVGIFSTSSWQMINSAFISSWPEGLHIITAEGTDKDGDTGKDSRTVNILPVGALYANIMSFQPEFSRSSSVGFFGNADGGTKPYTYEWKSDKAGVFLTTSGGMVDVSGWALGTHNIELKVTDAASAVSISKVAVKALEMAIMMNPSEGYSAEQGFDTWFSCNISGGTQPYNIQWTSSLDGNIHSSPTVFSSGESFSKDDLSVGAHGITLTVTDAASIVVSKSVNIVIKPMTPLKSEILSPADGTTVQQGVDVGFSLKVSGGVPGYSCTLKSNKDGILATSTNFTFSKTKNNLTVGAHTISLDCSDKKGHTDIEVYGITVTNPAPLAVTIDSPINNSQFRITDSAVDFKAGVSGGVTPYTYQWKSDKDGNLSTSTHFYKNNLSLGNHMITLTVKDAVGAIKTVSHAIKIVNGCSAVNTKNLSKYNTSESFIVPDSDWRDALSLVPVAIWNNGGSMKKYPMLIFHNEVANFDADSAIHFFQQYEPGHLTTVETIPTALNNLFVAAKPTGAGISAVNISNITTADYFSYWSSFNSIVIADYDNYKAGLLASVLASEKNAPLLFINSANLNSYKSIIDGRTVFTVDTLDVATQGYINGNAGCIQPYTLSEIQAWFKTAKSSDKLIIVNPKDLSIKFASSYPTKKSGNIGELFRGMSLAAPYLAVARNEVIAFTEPPDSGTNAGCSASALITSNIAIADTEIGNNMKNIFITKPDFLTIIASPKAIPDSEYDSCYSSWQFRENWDRYYSLSDNSTKIWIPSEVLTGRIYGITVTDASSYIVRELWYDSLRAKIYGLNNSALVVGHDFDLDRDAVKAIKEKSDASGYASECYVDTVLAPCVKDSSPDFSKYQMRNILGYGDHGGPTEWWNTIVYSNIPDLDLPISIGAACLTNNFWQSTGKGFGPHMLRRGAIGYFGAVGVSYLDNYLKDTIKTATEDPNINLGQIYNNKTYDFFYYILLGDPAFQPRLKPITW